MGSVEGCSLKTLKNIEKEGNAAAKTCSIIIAGKCADMCINITGIL